MLSIVKKAIQMSHVRKATARRHIVLIITVVMVLQVFAFMKSPLKASVLPKSSTPILVSGALSSLTITKIACGGFHSLALTSTGLVYAWGRGDQGQLGNGGTSNSYAPVQVSSLTNVIAIAAGYAHSIALKSDHTVWAWGYDASGQLGNGSCTVDSTTPVQFGTLNNAAAVAAGFRHSYVARSNGAIRSVGLNSDGELGDGTTTDSCTLVSVSGSLNHIQIATGANALHSLSLVGNNVYAWGDNTFGQLGNGTNTDSSSPVQVSSISTAASIAGGAQHSLAVLTTNTVQAWGNNSSGQLGNNSTTASNAPVTVQASGGSTLGSITQVSGGGGHSLARKSDNTVWAWGYNFNGELGDGLTTYVDQLRAVQVSGLGSVSVIAVAAGNNHSLALTSTGSVYAWGDNTYNQLAQQ